MRKFALLVIRIDFLIYQASKFQKHDFELMVGPKDPPSVATFWLGFETPDPHGHAWGNAHFWALERPKKSKMADKGQNLDFS